MAVKEVHVKVSDDAGGCSLKPNPVAYKIVVAYVDDPFEVLNAQAEFREPHASLQQF